MMLEAFRRIFENLIKLDKPTLAVVAGPALGAGIDPGRGLRHGLRRRQSAKFGHPEIKGGVFNTVAAVLLPAAHRPQEGIRDASWAGRA